MLSNNLGYYQKQSADKKRSDRMKADQRKRNGKPYQGSYDDFEREYYGTQKANKSSQSRTKYGWDSSSKKSSTMAYRGRNYSSNVNWGRGLSNPVLWVVIVLLFYFVRPLGQAFKGFMNLFNGEKDQATKDRETSAQEYLNAVTDTFNWSTVPDNENHYLGIADGLEYAMEGWGTDETAIKSYLNPLTPAEIKAVFIKFGTRENLDFENEGGNLCTWLRWELEGEDLTWAVNKMAEADLVV